LVGVADDSVLFETAFRRMAGTAVALLPVVKKNPSGSPEGFFVFLAEGGGTLAKAQC
jgi:hypothetical protein